MRVVQVTPGMLSMRPISFVRPFIGVTSYTSWTSYFLRLVVRVFNLPPFHANNGLNIPLNFYLLDSFLFRYFRLNILTNIAIRTSINSIQSTPSFLRVHVVIHIISKDFPFFRVPFLSPGFLEFRKCDFCATTIARIFVIHVDFYSGAFHPEISSKRPT